MMPLLPGTNEVRAAALLALQPLFQSDDGPLSTEAWPNGHLIVIAIIDDVG